MEKKYLLPALADGIKVDAGKCWEARDDAYDFLIQNMMLLFDPGVSVFEGGSNAIPHIFEQMLLFHKAFLDEKHPEHERAVAEWRAVLSIMALQRICNVQIDLVYVDLSGESNNPFLRAAYDFRPEDAPMFFKTTWDFLYILRLKKVPIAVFSPVTLVCPAKMFVKKIRQNLDNEWISIRKNDGKESLFFDFQGEGRELHELRKWLDMLKSNLEFSGIEGKSKDKYEKVMGNLQQFADEYGRSGEADAKPPIKKGIYSSINTNVRKEYDFLNNCCDVMVENPKLRFLVNRYREDVFEDKLLLLVYDEAPNTMEKPENIHKLALLYQNVLAIEDDKPVIEVYDNGGRRMAACAFLPFKNRFISELIQNKITPSEFFGAFKAIYHLVKEQMEIILQIKGFPYSFRKKYPKGSWETLYAKNLGATYIWPMAQMDSEGWNNYYIYMEDGQDADVKVTVPGAVNQVRYTYKPASGKINTFQLCKSRSFPAYLCYAGSEASGFLPIRTTHLGTSQTGSAASVIIDMGHATTSISIIKEHGADVSHANRKEGQKVCFWSPRSGRIMGRQGETNAVNMNFVISDEEKKAEVDSCIKNMMHSFQKYDRIPIAGKKMRPFEDGQILFDSSAYLNDFQESIVSYINFEYDQMNQIDREKVHIFIEQLLVYVVQRIISQECSYIRVYFLHGYNDGDVGLGELKGLWNNALLNVRQRTGIKSVGSEGTIAVEQHVALGYYVYGQVYKENMNGNRCIPSDSTNVGVNIGWKNTQIAILSSADSKEGEQRSGNIEYAKLEYAGRNISMMADADSGSLNLAAYPKFLQILLGGQELDQKQDVKKMLDEFNQLFKGRQKDITHYQGVFDAIAMKIDEEGYRVSPDVSNNSHEFRYFIMAVSYNFLLLFLAIGTLLEKTRIKPATRLNLYLGGNGAKFLKWISNDKHFDKIGKVDSKEFLILPVRKGIMECLAEGAGLSLDDLEISLILGDRPEEQLTSGCRTMVLAGDTASLTFSPKPIETDLTPERCTDVIKKIGTLRRDIFPDSIHLKNAKDINGNKVSVVELIENERKEVCGKVVEEINHIDATPYQ